MGLTIRMILYALFSGIATTGLASIDPASGDLTIHMESLTNILVGVVGYVSTFIGGRMAKKRGGLT